MSEQWKTKQYCYFWISSDVVPASAVTEALLIEPDQFSVRGSRRREPTPVPVEHSWDLECRGHGRIDDQVTEVLGRIQPVADRVRNLVEAGSVKAGLTMVRYFDDEEGGDGAMGWLLTPAQVALLAHMHASVQADEYAGDETLDPL